MKNSSVVPISKKLILTLLIFVLFLGAIFYSAFKTAITPRALYGLDYKKDFPAIRGSIKSSDKKEFHISKSEFLYKAIIDTRYLDPNKKDLFVSLFSIFSGIPSEKIYKKLDSQKRLGKLVLSFNISSHTASKLNELSKLVLHFEHETIEKNDKDEDIVVNHKVNIFKRLKKEDSFYSGLDVIESGEKRLNPYDKTLTPVIGYVKKYENDNGITRVKGVKGLEKYYDNYLSNYKSGLVQGDKTVRGNAVFSKYSKIREKSDGNDIKLNINLISQKEIEVLLDIYKEKFQAKEIIASVMESNTGKVLALASSNRFNPQRIKQEEIGYLNVNAVEYQFEPGSVIKPIVMALVFDKKRVQQNELLNAFNKGKRNKKGYYPKGRYRLKPHIIGDDHRFKKRYITPEDTIVYSSNIGILQLAQRLSGKEFLAGYHKFGLGKKTGIDLPYEKSGLLHSLKQYSAFESKGRDNIYKATDSYGQGITSTFIQVLKAYSVFNNDGKIVVPKIATIHNPQNDYIQVISPKSANIVKNMLIKTVEKGTATAAKINDKDIVLGGKTGTSQIARKGKYQKEYISSFFGFANKGNKKYTIGITVFEPSYKYHYASQSAVPIFKDIVKALYY